MNEGKCPHPFHGDKRQRLNILRSYMLILFFGSTALKPVHSEGFSGILFSSRRRGLLSYTICDQNDEK